MILKNKTAVITGCNKGIGQEILKVFAENQLDKVFACVRQIDENFKNQIIEINQNSQTKIIPVKLDLSNEESVKKSANEIISNSSNIDILINNAATISTSLFQMTKIDDAKKLYNINFFSQFLFTQFILKAMTKNKNGSIVFVSSTSSQDGNVGRSVYSSSKSAINALALTLSKELGSKNIRVNIVAPGLTNTDMMKKNTPPEKINEVINLCSLKRFAEPREIANAVLFLSSNLSSYITGQTLRVDGGMK